MRAEPGTREVSVRIRVPFYDVDPMRVVWHGNYIKYFEAARDALFESRSVFLNDIYHSTGYLFPVIRCSAKYIRPVTYGNVILCSARVVEARRKIVTRYEVRLESDGALCTRGETEQVALKSPGMDIEYEIPKTIRDALEG